MVFYWSIESQPCHKFRVPMNVELRLENQDDYREVENLTREAFWDVYRPGCSEHLILHKLRNVPAFVRELHLVATLNDRIVGDIVYSRAYVQNDAGEKFKVLCMGPFSVLPAHQHQGIGRLLLDESVKKAKQLNYKAVILYGNPEFYARFGFKNAKLYNITTADGRNFDPFMVLDLSDNNLAGIEGRFFADPIFEVDDRELDEFEKLFPYREKHVTDTQLKDI